MTLLPNPIVALILPRSVAAVCLLPDDLDRLRQVAHVVGPVEEADTAGLAAAVKDAVVVITGWGSPNFGAPILAQAPRLKLLAHAAGTVKPFVSDALFDRGIRVITAAAANATPVAEFTVAMMVAMLKQIPWVADAFRRGDRAEQDRRRDVVRELRDMQIGLIGASRVGREVIRLLKPYPRLRIRMYDPYLKPQQAKDLGVELSSLEDVCRCTVVSPHAPNIPETHHMMNARTLALIPDHGLFINTSRGALVDEAALVAEVRRRPIYVSLDVTDPEPPAPDSPLRGEANIILTPHIAGAIATARADLGKLAIDEVLRFLAGRPLEHEVTRTMIATQA